MTEIKPQIAAAPTVVLVNPQLGENIGTAARAMANFSLGDLRLVNPRDGWPSEKALGTAAGASRVIEQARVYPDCPAAVGDLNFVYATTARPRDMIKEVLTPEAAQGLNRTPFKKDRAFAAWSFLLYSLHISARGDFLLSLYV